MKTSEKRVWPDDFSDKEIDWKSIATKHADEIQKQAEQIERLESERNRLIKALQREQVKNDSHQKEIKRLKEENHRLLAGCRQAHELLAHIGGCADTVKMLSDAIEQTLAAEPQKESE